MRLHSITRVRGDGTRAHSLTSLRRHVAQSVILIAAAATLAGCATGDSGTDATSGPATPLASDRPKEVPVEAPSTSPTAAGSGAADVGSSPSPGGDGDGQPNASGGEEDAPQGGLSERSENLARDLFDLANAARSDDGVDGFEWSDCAAQQAVDRASSALGKAELEHEELTFDCEASIVGENLVRGDGPAANLHQLWMGSDGHRENILNDEFSRMGVGCVAHAAGDRTEKAATATDISGWVCSQMFYG